MIRALLRPFDKQFSDESRKQWGWMLAFGIILILLGALGLSMLFTFTIVSVLYFGALLIAGGVVLFVDIFRTRNPWSMFWHAVIALLYVAAGAIIFVDPVLASATLTLVWAAILIAIGVSRTIIAVRMRELPAWGWMLFSGLIAAALGVMIIIGWPQASFWVIGLFVAVELIFYGLALAMFALAMRVAPEPSDGTLDRAESRTG